MHNPFDQLAKKVGKEALASSGVTVVQHEIARDAQYADLRHEPDPARHAERARLGLLGRIAEVRCLLEIFAHPPEGAELRACLSKHFAHWDDLVRKARSQAQRRRQHRGPTEPFVEPLLWIIAATVSAPILRKLHVARAPGWPPGVYLFGNDLMRTRIVVARELPRDRSTILVRLMAAGPLLAETLAELSARPDGAHERAVAEQIVVSLRSALGQRPSNIAEEEEVLMRLIKGGFTETRMEGKAEANVNAVLTVLRVRGIPVSDAERAKILAEKNLAKLERWVERAVLARSVDEVFRAPRRKAPSPPKGTVEHA